MNNIEISNGSVRARFQPDWGGLLSAFQFNHPDNGWVDAFVGEAEKPASVDGIPFFGCFQMVPFANRLYDGIMQTEKTNYPFPVQLTEAGLAIHGTGWDQPWQVCEQTQTSVVMAFAWTSQSGAYGFGAELAAHLQDSAIRLELKLRNSSGAAIPMGLGFHPWFPDIETSRVSVGQPLPVNRDSPWNIYPGDDFSGLPATFKPADFDGLDASFDNWDQKARIDLLARGLRLEMTAAGAVDRLHVFVMGGTNRFCLEPVSHKPGDLRDPAFLVPPGRSVSGQMLLTCRAI
ncbi:MAG: hypothetical protein HQ483_17885 [Rhodospirillales bacterium]|nr:hypothetical protein [Rhodospirillales bacterium]